MTSPHAHLPPTLLENQQAQTPYMHQGAYAIRRKQSPSPTPPPTGDQGAGNKLHDIPDSVRKSYVAQKLPVRQQSLAAAYHHGRTVTPIQEESKLNRAQTQYTTQSSKSGFARSATISSSTSTQNEQRLRNLPKRTSSIMNLSLRKDHHPLDEPLPPPPPLPPTVPKISTATTPPPAAAAVTAPNDEDIEEDFNFSDRPPSAAPQILPVVATDNLSIFSPETPINHPPFHFPIPDLPPIDTGKRRPSEVCSIDTATTVETLPERRRSSVKHSDVKMLHSRSDSTVTTLSRPGLEGGRRRSCDTEASDVGELSSPSPRGERTSIFLRMQQKREEQRRSIYAYRTPKYQGRQPAIPIAILSSVAKEFYRKIPTIPTLVKDNIEYHHVFSGREAVDRLAYILRTNDRNLAVLVGRALDAQNFFHDVNYEYRLRDTAEELYQFRGELGASLGLPSNDVAGDTALERPTVNEEEIEFPTGVFTLLTACYSPTCSAENPCYSWSCPRLASKDLKKSQSQTSLQDSETHDLWIHSVPEEIVKNTSPEERKRQECIYEFIRTEQDFVKDLQYVHNFWVKPLITSDIIPSERREHFVQEVFWNIADIEKVNSQLAQALIARQKEQAIVTNIGDIMLEYMCEFHPFVAYGAHQIIGKFYFELEKKRNPQFAQFVEETERKPESRRLELNGYLTKPTTRLGRYNLLLREILKRTPPDNPDHELIPQIMELITEFLVQVNAEAGKCENSFSLQQIEERLSFKISSDYVDLKLTEPGRQLVMKGRMRRKGHSSSDASDLQVFLFDNYLVFAKIKIYNYLEYYRVYRKPIPLDLLSVSVPGNNRNKRASSILPYSKSATLISTSSSITPKSSTSETLQSSSKSSTFPIIFYHHGRKGSPPLTLYASGNSTRKAWVEKIKEVQDTLAEKQRVFAIHPLVSRQFQLNNKINSSKYFYEDGERKILIGADQGVYISDVRSDEESIKARRIVSIDKVSQIDLIDNMQLLVLADKTLWTFPLDSFDGDNEVPVKRFRPISQHAVLFHVGECMGKTLVCVVKTNTLTPTTIRVLEPVVAEEDKKSRKAFIKRLVRTGPANLKPYKDLYLPSEASSISLLKTKMCVTCPQEIGVIDMKSFEVQALLDPDDEELSFVFSRPDLKPITIYRIQFAEYLVCYNEFAFFVDQRGRLKNPNRRIDWEGVPDSFALCYPYILAFEPEAIEIHNILTGTLDQRIRGTHIRCTNSVNGVIQVAMADPDNEGYHLLAQLDLVKESIDYLPPPIQFSTTSFSM